MVPKDPIGPLRSTLPRYCSMEAGGLLEVRPGFFGVVGEGLTFLTHIQSYRHGPTDLFSIRASSSATRFYLTKPRARPRREFALPNSLFDNKAESPDPTFISFEWRMKSALPQQAPTPIKMKSVTLLNKQEKPFTKKIDRAFLACCFLRILSRINRIINRIHI